MNSTPPWKHFLYEMFFYVAGGFLFLVLYAIWDAAQTPSRLNSTADQETKEALKKVEVVSAELLLRSPSRGDLVAFITLKNANPFRVHEVEISCAAFDGVGRRLRTQQEKFKRLRSHSLMKFQRERSFRDWKITESIKCSVDSVRLPVKQQ